MRTRLYLPILIYSLVLTACSTIVDNIPGVYSLDIQQGNIINQEMIDQLKPKMTKRQVLYIMGSSMLVDVFHQNRWDYLYSEQLDGEPRKQKRLSLFFDGDILSSIQGDFRPNAKVVTRKNAETTVDVPPRDLEKTLWEKITGLFSGDETNNVQKVSENETEDLAIESDRKSNPAMEDQF